MRQLSDSTLDLPLSGTHLDGAQTLRELVQQTTLLAFLRHHG